MARKLCPACNKLNAGSARECVCGHTFAEASIVAARRTTKRCPACRAELPRLMQRCGCGHEFEDILELRQQLVSRIHAGWSYLAVGTLVVGACVAIMMTTSMMWILGLIGGVVLMLRGLMTRADARSALRSINKAVGELPSAKVHR